MNKKIERVQKYLAAGKDYKRWRLWHCIVGMGANARHVETNEEIRWIELKGFKAKVWAPLPQHRTSGHTHIVVLCTFKQLCSLGGLPG